LNPAGHRQITVITGWREAGKTTFCQKVIQRSRLLGWQVAGLITPGRYVHGRRNGIQAISLQDGETRLLASNEEGELNGPRLGHWTFDAQTLAWGNQRLAEIRHTDLLVMDELGPLEFERQMGWTAALDVLRNAVFRQALVVIRPECLPQFSQLGFVYETHEVGQTDADDKQVNVD